jgi:Holliday junction resolvase RusA-like endonuclease
VTVLLAVSIPGAPVGKGRPRFARRGKFAATYTPEATEAWEDKAIAMIRQKYHGPILAEPLKLYVEALGPRPKSLLPKSEHNPGGYSAKRLAADPSIEGEMWRTTKPDFDNVLKCVADALVTAGVVRDDAYIVDGHILSLYTDAYAPPEVRVWVERAAVRGRS